MGAGYGLIVSGMLVLSYIPGPIERWHIVVLFAAANLILIVSLVLRRKLVPRYGQTSAFVAVTRIDMPTVDVNTRRYLAAAACVLILAAFFRFTNLAYSEFQGDEAAVALAAVDVIQGYDNALLVRLKGPAEVLLPALIYRATGSLTEFQARLPFAIANVAAVLAILLLGARLIGPLGGWIAAALLALDGYLIAFGRILQYQSLVFLMVVLTVLVLYRLARDPINLRGLLLLAAIYAATGRSAHYEAMLVIVPGAYLLWVIGRRIGFAALLRAAAIPLLAAMALIALFYVPFVRQPTFANTFWYLFGYRLSAAPEVDRLRDFYYRTTLYSTSYYLWLLIAFAVLELTRVYWRTLSRSMRIPAIAILIIFVAALLAYPDWLATVNVRILGAALVILLSVAWVSPRITQEERLIWLWYSATLIVTLFVTARPNSHVYTIFIPWALLAGLAVQHIWRDLTAVAGDSRGPLAIAGAGAILLIAFSVYAYSLFVHNRVEVLRTWPENRPRGFWAPYDEPVEVAIFGFPLRNGWNTIAALYDTGAMDGGFDTNARPTVASWYTRGRGPCARDDPEYFILAHPVEPTLADERDSLRGQLEEKYQLFATVDVGGEPHIEVFQRGRQPIQPQTLDDADYSRMHTGGDTDLALLRDGPIGQADMQFAADYRLQNGMWLRGFALEPSSVQAGDDLVVTLFWQAVQVIDNDYDVSVQVIDMQDQRKAGQRDGEPGCNQFPTTSWIPGDLIADRYRVPIAEDALAGDYTLLITVYTDEGPVDVLDGAGYPSGTSIRLTGTRITN